jgi:antitoxin ParD1/3/4
MASRATVNVSLTRELEAFCQSRVKSGRYQTTSEVIREALRLLQDHETEREEHLKQLKSKLRRGASQAERAELLDGDEVFEELRKLIKERTSKKKIDARG